MIQAFLAVLYREVVSLLRTRELYFYGLVPAVCGLPLIVLFSTIAMSFQAGLVLPTTDLGFTIEAPNGTRQRESTDPDEWAVTSWELRDGTLHARAQVENAEQLDATKEVLREILESRETQQFEAAGADPIWDRIPMLWSPKKDFFFPAMLFAITLFAAQISLYLIPSRTAEERAGGLFEALAVTATPIFWHLVARALAGAALIGCVFLIPIVTMILLVPDEVRPSVPLPLLLEGAGLLLCTTSCHVAVGCLVKNTSNALNAGSMLIFGVIVAWLLGLAGGSWIPVAGMGHIVETPVLVGRITGTWLLAFTILGAAGWWVRGPRALPSGHGDA